MTRFELYIRRILVGLAMAMASILTSQAQADSQGQAPADSQAQADSIEIGLITCSPHEEVYSLYGHSALRYHDLLTGEDIVFNYGIFNFQKPHFVLRFVFGLTDYELGVAPTRPFLDYYRRWGSEVTEQVLNLSAGEKQRVVQALAENLLPENKVYRYNYFYDNCSTRPRDIIERCVDGQIDYAEPAGRAPTYRELIHGLTQQHPWARFGNDMLLGLRADQPTTQRQREFLPELLMRDFDNALIRGDKGTRPLVAATRQLVAPSEQVPMEGFPVVPMHCFGALLLLTVVLSLAERHWRRTVRLYDAALMLLTGASGCIVFLMFFSQHPATSSNLLIFLLNPLPLFFIPAVVKGNRPKAKRYFRLCAVGVLLFFVGSFFQDYADGMEILALCLLIRVISNLSSNGRD